MDVATRASLYRHPPRPPHNQFSTLIGKPIDKGGGDGSLMMDVCFLSLLFLKGAVSWEIS